MAVGLHLHIIDISVPVWKTTSDNKHSSKLRKLRVYFLSKEYWSNPYNSFTQILRTGSRAKKNAKQKSATNRRCCWNKVTRKNRLQLEYLRVSTQNPRKLAGLRELVPVSKLEMAIECCKREQTNWKRPDKKSCTWDGILGTVQVRVWHWNCSSERDLGSWWMWISSMPMRWKQTTQWAVLISKSVAGILREVTIQYWWGHISNIVYSFALPIQVDKLE